MLECYKITEEEATKVAALENEIFPDPWSEKGISDTIHQSHAFIAVAKEADDIAGYCILYHVMDEGEIARIGVGRDCRRMGVGKRVLDYVVEECKVLGVERLLLDVRESNLGARAFYQNYGFKEDGIRKNFYDNPKEHAVLMSKELV